MSFTPDPFAIRQSRATAPLFYRAAHPPQVTPYPYQTAGVEYVLGRSHALIGDEPGLGKTLQAIMVSNALQARRTLVVCPASLRLNWEAEIWKASTIPNVSTYPVIKASHGISNVAHYVIVSYDLLRNPGIMGAIMDLKWDHVILDEAHALKDPQGNKRTRAICAPDMLPRVTGRFTMLSGTIMPNQPIEVYNTARLLDWDCIDTMSLEAFREHYYGEGGGMVRGPVWDDAKQAKVSKVHWSNTVRNQPRNLEELQARLRSRIMVRRLKEAVLTQLPRKQIHLVPLATTPEMRAALRHPGWAEVQTLYDLNPDDFKAEMPSGDISTARRLLGEAKAASVCEYVEELLASGVEKIVCTAWHTSVLAVAKARLAKHGLAYMDGSTGSTARQEAVNKFQSDPRTRIILGQTMVIGEGHTLTAAQDVVLFEPDYVPGRIQQAIDRIHRIGQKGDYVLAHLPVVPGTLDERIIATAVAKDRHIFTALDAA